MGVHTFSFRFLTDIVVSPLCFSIAKSEIHFQKVECVNILPLFQKNSTRSKGKKMSTHSSLSIKGSFFTSMIIRQKEKD